MTHEAVARFTDAVLAFREWADEHWPDRSPDEWGACYEDWPYLTAAFSDLLDATEPADWDQPLVERVFYALACDNEMEGLKDELVARPAHLLALANVAPLSSEPDARWQIADALGYVDAGDVVVNSLIERLIQDGDEYVSRRALIALTRRRSERLEFWATRAWDTGHEYQRMVALDALAASHSPLLPHYLDQADADGREFLMGRAAAIRRGSTRGAD